MRNSKLIKSFAIEVGSAQFNLSTGYQFDHMLRRISKSVFGVDDVIINESLAIGLLFDTDIYSILHVTANYMHFYEDRRPVGSLIAPDESEADLEQFEAMIDETIKFLKNHSDFLLSDSSMTYEDLTLSQYGLIAEEFETFEIEAFKNEVNADEFIAAVRKYYSVESLRDKRVARRVLRMIGTYSSVKNFMYYIVDNSLHYILIRDAYLPSVRAEILKQCVDQMFECNSELMKISDLTGDEYDRVYDIMTSKDTVLISAICN